MRKPDAFRKILLILGAGLVVLGALLWLSHSRGKVSLKQWKTRMTAQGEKTMDKAINMPDATPIDIHGIARFQQMSGNTPMAKKVFAYNAKRFPDKWPVNLGMARSFALSGDNKQAIAYARRALPQAPDDANRKNIEALIQQWSAPAASMK